MKILHTIGGFGAKSGGTSTCTYDLLTAIHELGDAAQVDILTPDVADKEDRLMGAGEEWIKVLPNDYRTPLSISKNLRQYLEQSDYDIYHTNGMWMYVNHVTCSIARGKGKPYVITPHGMLYPEAMARSGWKKQLMMKVWFEKDLREASCVHVTCEDEMKHVRDLGYKGPVALIGNPVGVPEWTEQMAAQRLNNPESFGSVAFLGRLHPRKKVENLIYGASICKSADVNIYIMGKGDEEYERFLRAEAQRLGLSERAHFLGFVRGREKFERLASVDALFVPSDMENFGMIIPESLIVGTPVMASLGTPWKSLNDNGCGWWRDNSPESIARVIDELYVMRGKERAKMGERGREYVLRTFAAEKIAGEMVEMYEWLAGNGDKPSCVYEE